MHLSQSPEVLAQRRVLTTLRDRFSEPGLPQLNAWLVHHVSTLSAAEACMACPYLEGIDFIVHGAKDVTPNGFAQHIHIRPFVDKEIDQFLKLASLAGNCLGEWSQNLGVRRAKLLPTSAAFGWIIAMFELEWAGHPGIPYETRRRLLGNREICQLRAKLQYSTVNLQEQERVRITQEIAQLESLGYYAGIADLYMSSVFAIDVLVHSPIDASPTQVPIPISIASTMTNGVTKEIPPEPKQYLFGWPEILEALGFDDSTERRNLVRRLNQEFEGCILFMGQGTQPKVDREKLIAWWNGLDVEWQERMDHDRNKQASVAERHPYGRDGTAIPGIAGSEKRRRRGKQPEE